MSHSSYTASDTFENGGPCPVSHPVRLPQLIFEVIWYTAPFNDAVQWPTNGGQPFVFNQGDIFVFHYILLLLSSVPVALHQL